VDGDAGCVCIGAGLGLGDGADCVGVALAWNV